MNTPPIDWKKYYNREHEIYRFLPDQDPAEHWRAQFVAALLPTESLTTVLDAGCGDAYQCQLLHARYPRMTGCDIAFPRLQFARQRAPQLRLAVASLDQLPFRPQTFDLITLVEVLEHLPDPVAILRHLRATSRRHLLVTVPHKQTPHTALCPHCLHTFPLDGHLHKFDESSFRALLESAGLRIRKLEKFYPPTTWETSAAIRWWPRPLRELLRRGLQSLGLVARDNALFIGALCDVA